MLHWVWGVRAQKESRMPPGFSLNHRKDGVAINQVAKMEEKAGLEMVGRSGVQTGTC